MGYSCTKFHYMTVNRPKRDKWRWEGGCMYLCTFDEKDRSLIKGSLFSIGSKIFTFYLCGKFHCDASTNNEDNGSILRGGQVCTLEWSHIIFVHEIHQKWPPEFAS